MLQIILIRPGSTVYDEQGRIQGTLDSPLSDAGREEVARAVESLRNLGIQYLYCSPNEASEETAQTIAKEIGVRAKTADKLHNLDQGLWQGMLIEDVKTKQPRVYRQWQDQPESVCPPEGEMVSAARQRVQQFLAKITRKHREGVIGLVVPDPLASVVRCVLRADNLADLWKPSECGSWETFTLPPAAVAGA